MAQELTFRGLVIHELAVGDSDKLLTVLAESLGKLLISCKGVRSIKSHRLASTQLFCYNEFTVSERGGRYVLKETVLLENFYHIRDNIEVLALSQYIADIVCEVSVEGEYDPRLLSLALNTLYKLSLPGADALLCLIKGTFELRVMTDAGFMPDLSCCSLCSAAEGSLALDINGGVLICTDCLEGLPERPRELYYLNEATLDAMRYVVSAPAKKIFSFSIDEELYPDFSEICEHYLLAHVEKSFDTLKFYHSLGF